MAGPDPVAVVRRAVRESLSGLEPGDLVLVACSGGADSLALAATLAAEAPKAGLRHGAVTVDHGLQHGSARRAQLVRQAMLSLGMEPVVVASPEIVRRGASRSYPGPEAAARAARYGALSRAADECGAVAVMLGHTLDDQAESVLLGLARGSGARSLAGMEPRSGRYLRPLLAVRREQTRAACSALGLRAWDDPHNSDTSFARVRVRRDVLPAMEEAVGPGVAEALARTAVLLRADARVLDLLADALAQRLRAADGRLLTDSLARLPAALRCRVLRAEALAAGCPAGALAERHVAELDRLLTDWHGQRWVDLPGGVRCERSCGRLAFTEPSAACAALSPAAQHSRTKHSEDAGGRDRHG